MIYDGTRRKSLKIRLATFCDVLCCTLTKLGFQCDKNQVPCKNQHGTISKGVGVQSD